ncbi:MAG: GNAT family N-acetyltransferase [Vicinamibacterales bacterium]
MQRRGLMTEACEVVTDYWFNVLKFSVLRAPKAAANIASRRISEKQGMRLVATEERDHVGAVAYWRVADINATIEHFRVTGASIAGLVQDVGDGIKVAEVLDPFGNVIGLIENPHFKSL